MTAEPCDKSQQRKIRTCLTIRKPSTGRFLMGEADLPQRDNPKDPFWGDPAEVSSGEPFRA